MQLDNNSFINGFDLLVMENDFLMNFDWKLIKHFFPDGIDTQIFTSSSLTYLFGFDWSIQLENSSFS
jgi:hypothetical protein